MTVKVFSFSAWIAGTLLLLPVAPLLAQGPERLVIANRTAWRAEELAPRFRGAAEVEGVALDAIPRARSLSMFFR